MKAVEEVTMETQKQAIRGVGMRILAFARHVALIIVSYLERMDAGMSAARSGRWLVPGLIDGGYPALIRFAQGLIGASKPVFWNGPTS